MSLTFHQTFTLDCENISKLLSVVRERPGASNGDIAEATGIGVGRDDRQGKVQPTIDYATYCGLIASDADGGHRILRLTSLGELVFEHDDILKKPISQWVMHYNLSREGGEAEAWSSFVHRFLPFRERFERSSLETHLQEAFGERAKVKSINPTVLLNCYTDTNALGKIRLLTERPKKTYERRQPYIPNAYVVGYVLAEVWEARHIGRTGLDPNDLLDQGHLVSSLGLKATDLQFWLDNLSSTGAITQMREAPPYQIVRRWNSSLELLEKAYVED